MSGPPDWDAVSQWLIDRATQHYGFTQAAILNTSEAFPLDREGLCRWLAEGMHATMDWMTQHLDKRLTPSLLMPGTQSALVVTLNYYQPDPPAYQDPDTPKIAKYARGRDYHKVIRNRLKKLLKDLQAECPEAQGRPFTDSAPILERALAIRAGLGWQGRHCNLISPQHGSFLFIGELLLNLPLHPPRPPAVVPDLCGRCRRCVDACPTDALDPTHRQLNAQKCLPYWTIEGPDDTPMPDEIAQKASGWLFGCDICQDVCPWNLKFAVPSQDPDLTNPRHPFQIIPDKATLQAWTQAPQQFNAEMAGTPLRRSSPDRLQATWHALFPQ